MKELKKLEERILELEYKLATVEHIQHMHSRKHRMLETGKTLDEIIEDENKLTELLEKNVWEKREENEK